MKKKCTICSWNSEDGQVFSKAIIRAGVVSVFVNEYLYWYDLSLIVNEILITPDDKEKCMQDDQWVCGLITSYTTLTEVQKKKKKIPQCPSFKSTKMNGLNVCTIFNSLPGSNVKLIEGKQSVILTIWVHYTSESLVL